MNATGVYAKPPPPQQQQPPPGHQDTMTPPPVEEDRRYVGTGKLKNKVAIITGGDSGIGRSIAIQFAKEGADICLVYLNEEQDAIHTASRVKELGRRAIQMSGDIAEPGFCDDIVQKTLDAFKRIDILVNNAATQGTVSTVQELNPEHVERTFKTNIFAMFYLVRAVVPHLPEGSAIINTTSVQAYDPSPELVDYAATKAAIVNFTQSLAKELAQKKIRVNAVAPGPIWTPLIVSTMPPEEIKDFGKKTLMKRPGQPVEVAPAYVFLAAEADSSFITGQVIHVNGGQGMHS